MHKEIQCRQKSDKIFIKQIDASYGGCLSMSQYIGIRREDKNKWERRVPLVPVHVKELKENHQLQTIIQPSPIRCFSDETYEQAGAIVQEDLSDCNVIFAVKEIPKELFEHQKTYIFFSHIIKGQKYNMPMLKVMMQKQCTLIDYEKIVDEHNRRLIFFGRYAGIAGMVDTLWAFGQRLQQYHNIKTPFAQIKKTYQYPDLQTLKNHLTDIGKQIEREGINEKLVPLIVGFAGYGNVSKGSQEIIDLFPFVELQPTQISTAFDDPSNTCIYKVVFKEEDMVRPKDPTQKFMLQEYYDHPERFESKFQQYLPNLSILMNCIYWDARYPRLLSKSYLKDNIHSDMFRLHIVGDISVDINGAIQPTYKVTTPEQPVYVYSPDTETYSDGLAGEGLAIMAVDNLPCELPKDASTAFSEVLWHFVPDILHADYTVPFADLKLPPEIKNAVILYQGRLTPPYQYINNFL